MQALFDSVPLFVPVLAALLVLSVASSGAIGRSSGVGRSVAGLLVASLGLIAAATLTPQRAALDLGAISSGVCDLSRLWFTTLPQYAAGGEAGGNVLMFIPLGVATSLVAWTRRRAALVVGAFLIPFAIEAAQLLIPPLDRACQAGDVFDNVLGLGIGLAVGATTVLVTRPPRVRSSRAAHDSS